MQKHKITHNIDSLLSLLLLALFGACILLVLIFGARLYQTQTKMSQESYRSRTAAQYFVTRVHQSESADSLSVTPYGDGDALIIGQTIDGDEYSLVLYCHDGQLREMLVSADADLENDFGPEGGDAVIEAEHLQLSLSDGLVSGTVTYADGSCSEFTALARGTKEAAA